MTAWLLLLPLLGQAPGTAPAKIEPNLPFRTDSANAHLPWYRCKPGEFPPLHSEHVVEGVLLEADFLHRSGQFRRVEGGELVDFNLLPSGTVSYCNAEADLRDVPIGTRLHFFTYQDDRGAFTRVAAILDDFTGSAREGLAFRLEENQAGAGRLVVAVPASGHEETSRRELRVDGHTGVWKGDKAAKIEDLAAGDSLLVNFADDGRCAEIWAGVEAQRLATDRQRARHKVFLKERGLPAWIDRVEGKRLTVTLLGEAESLATLLRDEGIDPARCAGEHRSIDAVVANEELRSYNPPVDRKRSTVLEYEPVAHAGHGCGGVRWVIEPDLLLEGFRKGRIIRLFAHPSWPVNDMPFGEGLYSEAPDFRPDRIDPNLYPFRTDSGNDHLPWYRPKPGEFPPWHSHHLVVGELVQVDDHGRSGRFRADLTGETVEFTMPPFGTVLHLYAEADLRDVPPGTRCRFFLHQDDRGAFTRAALVADEFERLAADSCTYRLEDARLDEGTIHLSVRHSPVKNEKDERIRPPDFGRAAFAVDERTRVWKGDGRATLRDLVAGEELLLNTTGRTATSRGVCTDIWAGAEAQRLAVEHQRTRHRTDVREHGLPAWVDTVEGKSLTITFFSGSRRDFPGLLDGEPGGKVFALLADDELRPIDGRVVECEFRGNLPEGDTTGTFGCSGVRWRIEPAELPDGLRPGRILRIFKGDWPRKPVPAVR